MNYSLKNSNKKITYLTLVVFLASWPLSFYGFQKHQNIDLTVAFTFLFFAITLVWQIEERTKFNFLTRQALFVGCLVIMFSILSVLSETPLYEVLVGIKPLILFFFFFLSVSEVGLPNLPSKLSTQVVKITCYLMFAKYLGSHLLGLNDRPYLFTENNYELVLPLAVLFCVKGKTVKFSLLLISTIILSGSKSAIGSLLLLPVLIFAFNRNFVFKNIIFLILAIVAFSVYNFGLLDGIDRIFYLNSVLAFYDTSILNLLFGNFRIEPLQSGLCEAVKYMGPEKVIFDGENYICYSRVVNFISLRLFIDYGIVFAVLFLLCWFTCLIKVFPMQVALSLFLIGFLNGLSVNGFGNIFFFITLLLVYSFRRHKKSTRADYILHSG